MSIVRRLAPNPRSTRGRLGIFAFLVTLLVLIGSSASFAYWTASATSSSTLSAASLTLSTSNFSSVGYTFTNDSLTTTGSVTVTNSTTTTSSQSGAVTVTFGPNADATLAGKVTLTLWPTSSASSCTAAATVPGGATTALWSASTSLSLTMAPAASVIYCVRSSIASREAVAVAGGTISFSPKISGTITVGNFTGSTSTTTTQATRYIYPAFTGQSSTTWNWIRPDFVPNGSNVCADVFGGAVVSGTQVISFNCSNPGSLNQLWQFTPVGTAGYYTIAPKNSTGLRLDNQSTNNNDSIVVTTASSTPATALNQLWQLQLVATGTYQIVNAYNGYCLNPAVSGGHYSQYPCNGQATQHYFISPAFDNFTCSTSSGSFVWSWSSVTNGPFHVMVTHGGITTELVTTAATATGATLAYTVPTTYGVGVYQVAFVDTYGTAVSYGSITINATSTLNSCSATRLTP